MEITAPSSPALSPVSAPERILTLDVLRGIALFGVLTSNIWADFSGHSLLRVLQQQPAWAMPDTVANFLIRMLVKGKAMSAFSFLFGLGFAVQMFYSRWWLARYRFGPMEWLWRSLTYGQMQPMRRPEIAEEEAVAPVLAG
jgi:uncharacterized membrane protein YeiB